MSSQSDPGPAGARQDEIGPEQSVVDAAYQHLARMRRRAQQLLEEMAGTDPDLDWALQRRAKSLSETPRALCFGRTDALDGTTWYIGRRHVEDEKGDPLVIEWRAPVALPFYRASWADPMGLARRRQFVVEGRKILSIGDDTFGAGRQRPPTSLRGAEALMVELERGRTGEMLDIVATIQPEQDEVIHAPAEGVMAVQGGPGSGKTAVGLHRAAFLLYADHEMARANVLVVGPNRTFLRYISQVLPSLGEHAVVQTTLVDLVPEVGPGDRREELPAADDPGYAFSERVKGDARWAEVLSRALACRRHADGSDLDVAIGLRRLVVPAEAVNGALATAAERRLPYSAGRDLLRDLLVRALYDRYVELAGLPADGSELGRALRNAKGLKAALDRRWPTVAPATLVSELLTSPARLAAAADGTLDAAEQRVVLRRQRKAWTPADGPLVDEAKDLIYGQLRTYGYAIVDEAQDLSPMELRMLARRCPSGSLTLLGDIAQAVGPWGLRDWHGIAAPLLSSGPLRVVELRHGYRSTSYILDFASRLLPDAAPGVQPVAAVRAGRRPPSVARVAVDDLVRSVVEAAGVLSGEYPSVGVIVPADIAAQVTEAAVAALPSAGSTARGLSNRVTVLTAQGAKGLEFDAVVVGEPAGIVAERRDRGSGLRLLYVALTCPTQHLAIVHSEPLPAALAAAS